MKEATARIKINKLLESAGWRFFADAKGPANIQLEPSVALTKQALDGLGKGGDGTKVINLVKSIEKAAEEQSDDPFLIALSERAKAVQESFEESRVAKTSK